MGYNFGTLMGSGCAMHGMRAVEGGRWEKGLGGMAGSRSVWAMAMKVRRAMKTAVN